MGECNFRDKGGGGGGGGGGGRNVLTPKNFKGVSKLFFKQY